MATLIQQCPHCLTSHIALQIRASTDIAGSKIAMYLRCPKCWMPAVATAQAAAGYSHIAKQMLDTDTEMTEYFEVEYVWPEQPKPNIPEHLPPEIVRCLQQAESNFSIPGNEESAGIMYRKALDIGLKLIDPEIKGTLERRIDKMVENSLLTPALGEWSHQIRALGNDSAHEIEARAATSYPHCEASSNS